MQFAGGCRRIVPLCQEADNEWTLNAYRHGDAIEEKDREFPGTHIP